MDDILELASELGKRIATDPRAKRMAEARDALDTSPEDRTLIADYESAQRKIHELELAGKPIEPRDKRRVADLHGKVVESRVLRDLLKAQADYLALMTLVSQRIEQEAAGLGTRDATAGL